MKQTLQHAKTPIKCAIVGYGYWGRNVLKTLCNQHRFCLKGIYDSDKMQAQNALNDFATLQANALKSSKLETTKNGTSLENETLKSVKSMRQKSKSTTRDCHARLKALLAMTEKQDMSQDSSSQGLQDSQNVQYSQDVIMAYDSYQAILRDDEIEAVFIITPPDTHFSLAKSALSAGKNVFVEKPLATSTQEAQTLYELANKQNLTLHCDHIFLYSPAVMWLKQNLASFGEILYVEARRINLGLFQNSVNVVWDLALHDLSILDFLFGLEIVSHSVHYKCYEGFEALANIQLECKNYSANLTASWLSPIKVREIMIGGKQKSAIYDETKEDKIALFDCGVVVDDGVATQRLYQKMVRYHLGEVSYPKLSPELPLDISIRAFGEQVELGGSDKWQQAHTLRVISALERICRKN